MRTQIKSSLEPEWTVYEPHFKNLKPRHESDPKNGWGAMEEQQKKVIEDNDYKVVVKYGHGGNCTLYGAETGEVISPFSTIKDMQDFKKKNNLTIVKNSRGNNMKKTIKSAVRDHYLLGKQNFLTEHVFGIDDDGSIEYEYDFGEELIDAEMSIFENSDTGFVGFDIESHRAGKTKTRHEVLDYDALENEIEGSDTKNGVAIYEDSNGIITVATMGSTWHDTKTGEQGTDYTLFKAVDYNAEPEDEDLQNEWDNASSETSELDYESAKKAIEEGKTVQWKASYTDNEWHDIDPRTSELVMARDMGAPLRIKSSYKPIKSAAKWVEDVADKKGITFEQVLEVFKDNGYGEDEADDFWNSKWNDVDDAFGEDGIAGLDELFGIEIETEGDDVYEDDNDVDYDKYHLDHGEVKTEDFQKELMNTGYSKEDIDYVFGNNKLFNMQYLDKYWQDRVRRELEFRKGKSVTSSRKSIKSSSMIYKENEMPSVMKDRIYWEIYYYNEGDNKELGTQNRYDSVRGMSFTQAKRRAKQLMKDYNCDTACIQTTGGHGVIIKNDSIGDKNMKIQSKRLIKSGTSNFVSNDGGFPLVVYIAEEYVYDEETDTQTEERDYDLENLDYEDAISNAEDIAEEKGISLCKGSFRRSLDGGDDYSSPYNIGITSGYYEGIQIQIEDNDSFDPEYMAQDDYDYTHDDSFYDLPQEEQDRLTSETEEKLVKEQEDKINDFLNELCTGYGWIKLGVTARFSNGETMYHKIDNSRKPIQSANYDGIKKQMQYTLDVLKEDAEDSGEEYAERMGYDGTDAGAVRYAINRFKDEYGIRNRYNIVTQSELADWLAGLPLSFDYANYNILQKGVEWGYLPPIQEGTDLTRKEANWLDNWWNGLANNILKLARKYNVGITSSRKPVTSGLTFRQAVQDFKAAGQWNDYYEMQQDWESYKDGLERDGLISEKTRSTWGNPCTPETFKCWNK